MRKHNDGQEETTFGFRSNQEDQRTLSDGLTPGSTVGEYVIESKVTQGGFAIVYRARSTKTGRLAAVKVLRPELVVDMTLLTRFKSEAEMLGRLRHPAIVEVYEIGELAPWVPFLIMEWIDGSTLSELLRRRRMFSLHELMGVLEPLCGALSAAHGIGIIHRDIKPSNVMVVPEGEWFRLKLLDFGIAKIMEADGTARRELTATGAFVGTPTYMAPEQFLGRGMDVRTDVYSLGVLAYCLLTGKAPFKGGNPVEVAEMHLSQAAPRVSASVRVPAGVDDAIARCLEKEREDRYPSVRDFLEDMRRAAAAGSASQASERRSSPAPAVWQGIYVAASFSGVDEDITEEVLVQIDESLDRAHDMLTASGLTVTPGGGNAVLGVRADSAASVAALIKLALDLYAALKEVGGDFPDIFYSIAVHAAGARQELIEDTAWRTKNPWDMVIVTRSALTGLEHRFTQRAIMGTSDRVQVMGGLG